MEQDKKQIRQQVRSLVKALTPDIRASKEQKIWTMLQMLPAFTNAKTILMYWSMPDEVATHDVVRKWAETKRILLPVVKDKDLELRPYEDDDHMKSGAYNILEPTGDVVTDYSSIDLCVVPGVAFDRENHRMGHGCGYYDRLLPQIEAPRIGVCYTQQIIDHIESQPWDVDMDMIVCG